MLWSSATNISNKYVIYFEAKSHWIQAGVEPGTFQSQVAPSAIWATVALGTSWLTKLFFSGFPFLGNDFFASLGDLFSCHAIDNPSMEAELAMLRQYGPDVPENTLNRLVKAFSELRHMADEGQIQYPYSTREVVNIVKHLQLFPNEGLGNVVRNVFDFDSYDKEARDTVNDLLHKHGM